MYTLNYHHIHVRMHIPSNFTFTRLCANHVVPIGIVYYNLSSWACLYETFFLCIFTCLCANYILPINVVHDKEQTYWGLFVKTLNYFHVPLF